MIDSTDQGFVTIQSSELFFLENELADVGSRAFAYFIDLIVRIGFVIGCSILFSFRTVFVRQSNLIFIPLFLLWWNGYYILFEMIMSGKTPGKKIAGIRTIRADGAGLSFIDSCIRNLLRVIDGLPVGYILAFILMLVDRFNRRIGDIVSNTIVIYDRSSNKSIKAFIESSSIDSAPRKDVHIGGLNLLSQDDTLLIKQMYARLQTMKPGMEKERLMDKFYDIMTRKLTVSGTTDPEILLCEIYKRI